MVLLRLRLRLLLLLLLLRHHCYCSPEPQACGCRSMGSPAAPRRCPVQAGGGQATRRQVEGSTSCGTSLAQGWPAAAAGSSPGLATAACRRGAAHQAWLHWSGALAALRCAAAAGSSTTQQVSSNGCACQQPHQQQPRCCACSSARSTRCCTQHQHQHQLAGSTMERVRLPCPPISPPAAAVAWQASGACQSHGPQWQLGAPPPAGQAWQLAAGHGAAAAARARCGTRAGGHQRRVVCRASCAAAACVRGLQLRSSCSSRSVLWCGVVHARGKAR
jgi:hypothetical protein